MNDQIDEMYAAPKEQGGATATASPAGRDVTGWILFAIPPISGILTGILTGTGLEMVVSFAMVMGCAFGAGLDGRQWRFRSAALGMVLLFIVFYPVHFYRRGRKGAPLGFLAGLAGVVLWIVMLLATVMLRGAHVL